MRMLANRLKYLRYFIPIAAALVKAALSLLPRPPRATE